MELVTVSARQQGKELEFIKKLKVMIEDKGFITVISHNIDHLMEKYKSIHNEDITYTQLSKCQFSVTKME